MDDHPRQATLFLSLVRPALVWGKVPFAAFWANFIVAFAVGLELKGHSIYRMPLLMGLYVWIPAHLIMVRLTRWDSQWANILQLWFLTTFNGGNELACLSDDKNHITAEDCSSAV